MSNSFKIFFLVTLLVGAAFAHEPSKSSNRLDEQGFEILETGPSQEALQAINQNYIQAIRPIFREKCFDCHSSETRYPRYYKFPGARQLIDRDIREGRKHIDMTCFLKHDSKGDTHKTCAQECAAKGLPIGILTDDGKIYQVMGKGHEDLKTVNQPLVKYMETKVIVVGEVFEKQGERVMVVEKIKAQ